MYLEAHDWRIYAICSKLKHAPCGLRSRDVPSWKVPCNFAVSRSCSFYICGRPSVHRNFLPNRSMIRPFVQIIEGVLRCIDATARQHVHMTRGAQGQGRIARNYPPIIEYTSTTLALEPSVPTTLLYETICIFSRVVTKGLREFPLACRPD